jgi:hypothetical protein
MTSKLVAMTFEEASRWIASQEVRICELEAQLADVLQANQTHCGMLSEAGVRIRELEAALDDIASRTDYTRDDCGKRAAEALASETACLHTFDIPYTRLTTAGGETGRECSKCGITNVQVGLAEHARETEAT